MEPREKKETPVSVLDVAAYILKKTGELSTLKLQKLVYYCQAWSLVWDDAPLYSETIEAWVSGPVVRKLYNFHRNEFAVSRVPGDPDKLSNNQRTTINAVLRYYGKKSSQWLSDLTHMEEPWRKARKRLPPNERGTNIITLISMAEYYSGIGHEY